MGRTVIGFFVALGVLLSGIGTSIGADELVPVTTTDGTSFNYILTTNQPQKIAYAVILMPGGGGQLNPRLEDGKLVFAFGGNFLIRSRTLFADNQFVAASTNSTTTPGRILAIVADLERSEEHTSELQSH